MGLVSFRRLLTHLLETSGGGGRMEQVGNLMILWGTGWEIYSFSSFAISARLVGCLPL